MGYFTEIPGIIPIFIIYNTHSQTWLLEQFPSIFRESDEIFIIIIIIITYCLK